MTTDTIDQTTTERLAEAQATLRRLTERKGLLPGQYRQAVARGEASTMAALRADLELIDTQILLAGIAVEAAQIALLDEQDAEQGPRITACGGPIGEAQREIDRTRLAHEDALLHHRQALGLLRMEELTRDNIRQQRAEAVQRLQALKAQANDLNR